jgi:Xaa-Pro dipeptidase
VDHAARRAALRARLERRGLAAWVLVPGPGLRYLTGLVVAPSERVFLRVEAAAGPGPVVICPAFEAERVKAGDPGVRVVPYLDEAGPGPALARTLAFLGTRPVAVGAEFGVMRLFERAAFEEAVPRARWHPLDEDLAALRQVKDAQEVAAIRRAAAVAREAVEAAVGRCAPGVREAEVRRAAQEVLLARDSFSPFGVMVASGPRSADPHAADGDRVLMRGDLCWVDLGAVVDGYCADVTRTVAVGPTEADLAAALDAVGEAASRAVEAVRPGVTAAAVDAVARGVIASRGLGARFTHRTGHGVGLEVHEHPFIVDGNESPLLPGMVFTVEPGVYLPGRGGARQEDTVLVTPDGVENLTAAR